METSIWKYKINLVGLTELQMPKGAEILRVEYISMEHLGLDAQLGDVFMWAWVTPELKKETRKFKVVGTGCPVSESAQFYVGTVMNPPFVWHVFELFS